ncbi:hypothetical protein L6164_028740 [Bauhinia variegata]|uniref:Uncharacterized protein n=1 Tax=Bauhinia variegata TaxID=167791 RepID=A0ACB9L743_BAUVA|nr:hypothetical protein L6164_028740 [Bauhinia variegata]
MERSLSLVVRCLGAPELQLRERPTLQRFCCAFKELANSRASLELGKEDQNVRVVTELYKALSSNDTNALHGLLAPELEWWFHGPPCHRHHLFRLLAGCSSSEANDLVVLVPDLIVGFGSMIIAEGYDKTNLVWWVHAWTITDGIITQVREYLNTSVTVTRLGIGPSLLPELVSPSAAATVASNSNCQCIWQSKLSDDSVPGLILAL